MLPTPQGKATANAPKLKASNGGPDRAIVAREDAIESVRILRHEAAPAGPAEGPDGATNSVMGSKDGGAEARTDEAEVAEAQTVAEARTDEAEVAEAQTVAEARTDEAEVAEAQTVAEAAGQRDVQGLFARIRASRTEAITTARKTLDPQDEPGPSSAEVVTDESAAGHGAMTSPAPGGAEAVAEEVPIVGSGDNGHGPVPDETGGDQEFFRRRDAITGRLESSLARKLKRALQDEQNSLLDRLRNLKVPATPANVLPNVEEHPDRFVDAGRPLLEEAARAGADLVAALWGGTVPPNLALEGLDDLAEELGRAIAEPLRQRLEIAFQSMGEDNAELADALGAAYREWKTQRIEEAAHDEVTAAFSRGSYLAFANGTPLRWVAGSSDAPCPDCEDNALAGEQVKSEPWPTGQLYPPAHPGCRCALAPDLAPGGEPVGLVSGGARPATSAAAAS